MSSKRKSDEYEITPWYYNVKDGTIICGICRDDTTPGKDEVCTNTSKVSFVDISCKCCGWNPLHTGVVPPNKRMKEL
jgi:hypothetical protein